MEPIIFAAPGDIGDFTTGSGLPADAQIGTMFSAGIVALVFLWSVWVLLGAWRNYSAGDGDSLTLTFLAVRVAVCIAGFGLLLGLF